MTPFLGPQPWEAPDPLPVMRRELKLLLIEMNLLRVEAQPCATLRPLPESARSARIRATESPFAQTIKPFAKSATTRRRNKGSATPVDQGPHGRLGRW
jgi:hypothetical protein